MLVLLDILFTIVHTGLILFNLTGWIWKRTRRLHLITLVLTAASWGVLGIWYGWGYCPLTDLHWDIKHQLGQTHLPNSFIKYLLDKITGKNWPPRLVDRITLASLLLAVAASLYVNIIQPYIINRKRRSK